MATEMRKKLVIINFVLLIIALNFNPVYSQTGSGEETNTSDQIVLLGTGTPNTNPDRMGPSTAVVVDNISYIFDAGPGVVRRAAAAARGGIRGLRARNLTKVFITHLHSDHTVGLTDLIFTPWAVGRNVPLEVFGPPGILNMTNHLLAAFEEDIAIRINGRETGNIAGYKVNAFEVKPGEIYKDDKVTIIAFQVNHGTWEHAYGYRIETPERVIVISGDTAPSEELIRNSEGCDVLIHEVYSTEGFNNIRNPRRKAYHSSFHTSTEELANIANRIKPKLVILHHQLLFGSTPEKMLAEIANIYKGKVVYGNDLEIY